MVPVGQCQRYLFVELSVVGIVRVVDDVLSTEAVWVLATAMRVIPVRARLIDL